MLRRQSPASQAFRDGSAVCISSSRHFKRFFPMLSG
jgi:hypothetical protein